MKKNYEIIMGLFGPGLKDKERPNANWYNNSILKIVMASD
jgi:hypothetical protein